MGRFVVVLALNKRPCIVRVPFVQGAFCPAFIRWLISMRTVYGRRLLAFLCGMWLVAGCASAPKAEWPTWMTFGKTKDDGRPKVVTPRDKMEQLRELTARGRKMSPELQERVSSELAQGIVNEQDPVLRAQILRTLGRYPTEKAGVILSSGLHDHDRDVRIAACEALGVRGGEASVAELARVLADDADVDVRLAAARGLSETASTQGVAALGDALEDQDPAIQRRAMASMKKLSGQDFGGDVGAWRQYAKTGQGPPPPSLAQRLRKLF